MDMNKEKSFDDVYENYYSKKIQNIKNKYPEITQANRRTGKALKNICFFIWHYAKDESDEIIDLLLRVSVLISAQDDFYDNLQVGDKQKIDFYSSSEKIIEGRRMTNHKSKQCIELLKLWKEIASEVAVAPHYLYSYWQKKATELNKAMIIENNILRQKDITFHDYMENSVYSIGMMFLWASYLAKKDISRVIIGKIDPTLFIGAKIARLSNDVASYRRKKNKINAITTVANEKNPRLYILKLIEKEHNEFNEALSSLQVENTIKDVFKESINFLASFYKKSDFDQ